MNVAVTRDPRNHDPGHPRIKTKLLSFKSVESHGSFSKTSNKWALNFNMLYNANVILKFYIESVYCLEYINIYYKGATLIGNLYLGILQNYRHII